jgi:beta-glucosidase-like glycosyl hydrolase/CubicO group peptidase (beta-lactamase class C family)
MRHVTLIVALAALGCAARPPRAEPPASRWVEATLASLTLREKVGQLTNVWIPGSYVSTSSAEFDTLAQWVDVEGLGGVTISMGLPHSYVAKLNALQRRAKVPLLVAADLESGPGMRLNNIWSIPHLLPQGGGTVFPPAMGFGAIADERFAYELGRITGVEARAVGVHISWAPVLDVNSNPDNPIINTRAFGEDPEEVARLGVAYIAGAHAAGLLATAKHFPGHGDTREDSHIELAVLGATRARLDSLELVPFRSAVDAGVDAVMSAHVATPEILGPQGPPATLSSYFMTTILRDELGFRGLAVSDALNMGAIRERYGVGEAAVLSVEAGNDVILFPPDLHAAIEAVTAAVREGRISEERIDASVRRVLEAKARAGLHHGRLVDFEAVDSIVGSRRHLAFAESAAARSITLVRDRAGLVPLGARLGRVLSVTYARDEDPVAGLAFDAALRLRIPVVDAARVEPRTSDYDELRARADSADMVVIAAYVPPEENVGTVGVPDPFAAFVTSLERAGRGRPPTVVVAFGSPYLLTAFPDVGTYMIAWGGQQLMQTAAARALLGEAPITGRLPISLPPFHRRGEGLDRQAGLAPPFAAGFDGPALARVDSVIAAAIADSATAGAALAVGRRGLLVRLGGYGRLDWDPAAPAATDSTIWDIASLTKVVATTSAIMMLVGEGKLELDQPVSAHLPWFVGGGKDAITVRDLLLHRGGLPPFRPWWRAALAPGWDAGRARDAYRDSLAAIELVAQPGDSTIYSDLGSMTLGFLVEAVSGEPLDDFARERLFEPLGMRETTFTPPASLLPRIAPTEVDTFAGRGHVRGIVHDENAWAMGGVAGQAGVFSTARDLARFAEAMLNPRVLDPALVARFVRRADPASSRALGWDTPSEGSSAGRFLSERAFGHTGFTGTSIWIDPELDLFVVLLTNRVNPTRENAKYLALRRAVHEAVACAVVDARPAGCP